MCFSAGMWWLPDSAQRDEHNMRQMVVWETSQHDVLSQNQSPLSVEETWRQNTTEQILHKKSMSYDVYITSLGLQILAKHVEFYWPCASLGFTNWSAICCSSAKSCTSAWKTPWRRQQPEILARCQVGPIASLQRTGSDFYDSLNGKQAVWSNPWR